MKNKTKATGNSPVRRFFKHRRAAIGVPVEAMEARVLLSTYTVNTLSDAASLAPGLMSLRQAVAAANAHAGADTVAFSKSIFAAGSLHTIKLLAGQISFTDKTGATTVTGPGAAVAAVDGNAADRISNINAAVTVSISGLTVTHGAAKQSNHGGGIFNAGTLGLTSVTVTDNTANELSGAPMGGGIFSSGHLTLVNSTVSGNTAMGRDDEDYVERDQHHPAYGGGIYSTGALAVTASTVEGNSAVAGFFVSSTGGYMGDPAAGGAIYSKGPLTITGSTVSSNVATGQVLQPFEGGGSFGPHAGDASGGGIYATSSLSISQTTLSGNRAIAEDFNTGNAYDTAGFAGSARGGAICATGVSVTITSSSISGNKINGGNGVYATNGGRAYGGGVFASHVLTITGTTVSNNTAAAGLDSAVAGEIAGGGGAYCAGDLTLNQSTISGNKVIGGNGGYERDAGSDARGGGVDVGGRLSASQSNLTGNSATGGNGREGNIGPVLHPGAGGIAAGGAAWTFGAATLANCTVANNTATGGTGGDAAGDPPGSAAADGGAAEGGGICARATLTLNNTTISGNIITGGRGGDGYVSPNPLSPVSRPGKSGDAQGGGVWVAGAFSAVGSSITTNSARGGESDPTFEFEHNDPAAGATGSGGGAWTGNAATLTNCTIANNTATGGAGRDAHGLAPDATSSLPASDGGSADAGAIDAQASLKLFDSTVSGNIAIAGKGGTGYPKTQNAPLQPPGKNGTATGGGISAIVFQPLFNNTIISANKAGAAFNDIAGTALVTSSHNLIGGGGGLVNGVNGNKVGINNPKLSALGNYGGPTQTMIPLAGSPAIDAGSNTLIPAGVTTDQRGLPRIFNKTVDIGATEYISLTLTGSVYNDTNGDGARQLGEVGLANWQVYIDLANTGVYAVGDPIATTDASGNFTLTYSPTSTQPLIIREVRQNNWRRTQPAGLYPLGFYTISPTASTVANINFGNSATALVTGAVFHDANANGKQDAGDAGLSGWQILVDYFNNGIWQTNKFQTVTDSDGNYSLVLAAGTYRIHEVSRGGLRPTLPVGGTVTLTLANGATQFEENFGSR